VFIQGAIEKRKVFPGQKITEWGWGVWKEPGRKSAKWLGGKPLGGPLPGKTDSKSKKKKRPKKNRWATWFGGS